MLYRNHPDGRIEPVDRADPREYEICKKRGHIEVDYRLASERKCRWCGLRWTVTETIKELNPPPLALPQSVPGSGPPLPVTFVTDDQLKSEPR
jgi:hypothetical protein